jgi:hypothetical protein
MDFHLLPDMGRMTWRLYSIARMHSSRVTIRARRTGPASLRSSKLPSCTKSIRRPSSPTCSPNSSIFGPPPHILRQQRPRYGALHRVVCVDVYTCANIDVITNKQSSARAIENHVRADPTILADCHVQESGHCHSKTCRHQTHSVRQAVGARPLHLAIVS